MIATLDRRPSRDRDIPAFHVRILIEIDGLPLVARDPRPDRDVGNRIFVRYELAVGEPTVQHAVEAVRLLEVTLLGIRRLSLVVSDEMMNLAEHGPNPTHLPHQPFDDSVAGMQILGHK